MSASQTLRLTAADGQKLGATRFVPAGETKASIVIGPAMGVPAAFYHRFATFLAEQGYAVTTFDYRGIGASLDAPLRNHPATLTDWFSRDYPAAIASARADAPGRPLYLLGHSLGAQVPGLMPEVAGIDGMLGIATGSGYWRETAKPIRNKYPILAYIVGPVAIGVAGYFPGKRLGVFDDVPGKAMRQWVSWCKHRDYCAGVEPDAKARFARATFPVHYLSFSDDEFMTQRSTEAMLGHYVAAPRSHTRVAPAQWNEKRIGHFGFFRKEMAAHWPRAVKLVEELPAVHHAWRQAA